MKRMIVLILASAIGSALANVPPPQVTRDGAMKMLAGTWFFSTTKTPAADVGACQISLMPEQPDYGARTQLAGQCDDFPVLKKVFGWEASNALGLMLEDANFEPLLTFSQEPDRMSYTATAQDGTVYVMTQQPSR